VADRTSDAATIDTIRTLLERADYTRDGIAAIGVEVGLGVRRPDVPILRHALEPVEPLATLVRLFLLIEPVESAHLDDVAGPAAIALIEAGFVRREGNLAVPTTSLTPWREFIICHDPDPSGQLWPEHVSGPTPAAETLLALVTAGGGRALDLGTGCGLLAVALSRDVETIVGTDVNPAAARFARQNARLNGLANLEVREGSLFEPVSDDSFRVIVSNPPFVISPESDLVFRHSSFGRDEISREVARGVAGHLEEGGFGYLLANWVVTGGADSWLDVPRMWLESSGCDLIALLQGVEDPLAYAVRWSAREQQLDPEKYPTALEAWLDHFAAEGIDAIASAALILRRRSGPNWVHGLRLSGPGRGEAAGQVQRIAAGRDLLEEAGEEKLVELALDIPGDHRLEQSLVARDGDYSIEPATLVPTQGLAIDLTIDPALIPVVLRLDGSQRLHEIVTEIADGTGQDAGDLTDRVLRLARRLLECGLAVAVRRSD
jgi:methylase of polypeptide subunit release factors